MKNILYVLFRNSGAMFLSLFVSLYIRRELGPSFTGALALVNVFILYLNMLCGVFRSALDREVPTAIGKGQLRVAEEIHNLVYWIILVLTVASSLLFICCSCMYWDDPELRYAFLVGIALNGIVSINNYLQISFKVNQNFRSLAIHGLAISCLSQLAYGVGVFFFGVQGYVVTGLAALFFILIFYYVRYGTRPLKKVNLQIIKKILSVGIPLSIFSLILAGLTTIDRWFIIHYFSRIDLGYYSLALLFPSVLLMIPTSMSTTVLMPKWFQWAAQENWESLRIGILTATIMALLITSFICVVVVMLIPYFIDYVLPDFRNSIDPAQILVFSVYWSFLYLPFSVILSAKKQFLKIIVCGLIAIIFSILLNYLMVKFGIEGIAWATLITLALFSNLLFLVSQHSIKTPWKQIFWWFLVLNSIGAIYTVALATKNILYLAVFILCPLIVPPRKMVAIWKSYVSLNFT